MKAPLVPEKTIWFDGTCARGEHYKKHHVAPRQFGVGIQRQSYDAGRKWHCSRRAVKLCSDWVIYESNRIMDELELNKKLNN